MPFDLKFCCVSGPCFAVATALLVDYPTLACLFCLVLFFHFRIADQTQSQHTLNPDARECRSSLEASESVQRNGSNRYALYFIPLRTMNVKYLKKTEVLYVLGDLVL